jgi:endonuclease G, mitochondrial
MMTMRKGAIGLLCLAALAICPAEVAAQPASSCPQFFAGGQPPAIENPRLTAQARPLCYSFFGVLHSGATRTPLWAAERLTQGSVEQAACIGRLGSFHAESALPAGERAQLADYRSSGFDRGHMAPAGDMPTEEASRDSFTLANMVPQDHTLNTGFWSQIEATTQSLATRYGEIYVVTGPAFIGSELQALKGRVIVPTHIFKAIYIPSLGQAGAYYMANANTRQVQVLSVAQLRQQIGIDVFPILSAAVKSVSASLPAPRRVRRAQCPD